MARVLRIPAALALLLFASASLADDRAPRLSPALDAPLLGISLSGVLIPEILKNRLAPDGCRVCHRAGDGSLQLNAFDRTGRDALAGLALEPPAWARTSDVMAFVLLPLLAVATDAWAANGGRFDRQLAVDSTVIAESVFLSLAIGQAVKFSAGRQRPFVATDSPFADRLRHANENAADDNLSFFSGHSAMALATTVGTARLVQLRTGKLVGYYTLVPLGVLTSLMRMSADKHWATDVLVGMAVGSAMGMLIPALHFD